MINSVGLATSQMLMLDSNVEVNQTSTFNAQEAYENTFEDVLEDVVSDIESKNNQKLSQHVSDDVSKYIFQENNNPVNEDKKQYLSSNKGFEIINFKNAMNKYMLESVK